MLQEKTRVPTSVQLSTDPAAVEATTVKLTNTAPRHTLNLHATACPLWGKQCRTSLWSPPQIRHFLVDHVMSPAEISMTKSTASPKTPKQWHRGTTLIRIPLQPSFPEKYQGLRLTSPRIECSLLKFALQSALL